MLRQTGFWGRQAPLLPRKAAPDATHIASLEAKLHPCRNQHVCPTGAYNNQINESCVSYMERSSRPWDAGRSASRHKGDASEMLPAARNALPLLVRAESWPACVELTCYARSPQGADIDVCPNPPISLIVDSKRYQRVGGVFFRVQSQLTTAPDCHRARRSPPGIRHWMVNAAALRHCRDLAMSATAANEVYDDIPLCRRAHDAQPL